MLKAVAGLLVAAVLCFALCWHANAQTVTGTNGLITIPTGELQPDGTITAGVGYISSKYHSYKDGASDIIPYYVNMTFLPFVEAGFRFSKLTDNSGRQALGDRMLLARIQVTPERRYIPAAVIGIHDFMRSTDAQTQRFTSLYLVGSKNARIADVGIGLHAGYGTRILEADSYQFEGLFGGVSVHPYKYIQILAEYDGESFMVGPRILFGRYGSAVIGVGSNGLAATGVNLSVRL